MDGFSRVRVLLVEDEPKLAFAVRTLLELEPEIAVVGVVDEGEDAVRSALSFRPDVVVVDVRLRDGDGIVAACRLREQWPQVSVIVYSGDEDELRRARAAGFEHVLLKGSIAVELPTLVRTAAAPS